MRELFADFYGAWVLGAAYACSSILLRFSPSQADNVVAHHPPERLRTHLILQTLERVDPGYADVISALSDLWRELLVPFGLEPLGGGDAARIEQYLEEMIARVNQHLPKARYGGRKDVQKLVGPLTTGSLSPSKIAAFHNQGCHERGLDRPTSALESPGKVCANGAVGDDRLSRDRQGLRVRSS